MPWRTHFLWTIPQWNGLTPSVVNSQTTEEFKGTPHLVKTQPKDFSCFYFCFFVVFFVLHCFFFKIQNFTLPGIMIACDRASRKRQLAKMFGGASPRTPPPPPPSAQICIHIITGLSIRQACNFLWKREKPSFFYISLAPVSYSPPPPPQDSCCKMWMYLFLC